MPTPPRVHLLLLTIAATTLAIAPIGAADDATTQPTTATAPSTAESSHNPEALNLVRQGQQLLKDNKPADAADAFSRALQVEPDFQLARRGLIQSLVSAGKLDDAVRVLA